IAWLALEAVFFGIGSAILAVGQGRVGPAWDVAASVLAFGAAVAVSDRLAHRQIGRRPAHEAEVGPGPAIRWPVVLLMIAAGIAVLAPTLLSVGIPAFAARLVAAGLVAGAVLFAVVGVLRAYGEAAEDPLGFAVDRSVNRILLIEPRTLDAIQTAIPEEVPYFGGLTWIRRLAPLLGRDDVPNLGYWIYPRLFPDQPVPG